VLVIVTDRPGDQQEDGKQNSEAQTSSPSSIPKADASAAAQDVSPLEPRNFESVLHDASDAVDALADRLNAVVLRAGLLDKARGENGSANIDAYLARLGALVDSAAEQMRLIQKLLAVIETTTLQTAREQQRRRNADDGHREHGKK
jgi:hypothetical protein